MSHRVPRRRLRSIGNLIYITLGFIGSLLTVITVLSTFGLALLAWITNQQKLLVPLITFAIGIVVTLIVLLISLIYSNSIPVRWILRGYRWVRVEYLYCIEDEALKNHSQTIKLVLIPTRRGVNIIENKYLWTGHGHEETPVLLSPGHELMGSITKQQFYYRYRNYKYYYIYLGHELPIGEEIEVEIKQKLHDQDNRFEPYLAKNVTEPIKNLKLRVQIPIKCVPTNAYNLELNHPGPNSQTITRARSTMITSPNAVELCYDVTKPQLGHRYEIRWEW